MEQSENILLKKAKIEVLENEIRVLKEEIAKERGERIKRTGYVILSEPEKGFDGERGFISDIDIHWVNNEKNTWTDDGIWEGEYELRNWSWQYIDQQGSAWLTRATIFKTKEVAEFMLKKIQESWGDTWHLYDMKQCKQIMMTEPRYINSEASKTI